MKSTAAGSGETAARRTDKPPERNVMTEGELGDESDISQRTNLYEECSGDLTDEDSEKPKPALNTSAAGGGLHVSETRREPRDHSRSIRGRQREMGTSSSRRQSPSQRSSELTLLTRPYQWEDQQEGRMGHGAIPDANPAANHDAFPGAAPLRKP